jgi:prepilin-type processing-associated H-X9-DG protein
MIDRTNSYQGRNSTAFTRLELFSSLAAAALFTTIIVPALANSNSRSDRVVCLNNLRQIGVAYTQFGLEHNDLPPWWVRTAEGGNSDYPAGSIPGLLTRNTSYVQFSVLSNSLDSPRVLADPADMRRDLNPARFWNFAVQGGLYHVNHRQRAISYFIGLDATFRTATAILAGDRNMAVAGSVNSCSSGIAPTSQAHPESFWTNDVHGLSGNLLFYDGSVRQTDSELRRALHSSPSDIPGTTESGYSHMLFPF